MRPRHIRREGGRDGGRRRQRRHEAEGRALPAARAAERERERVGVGAGGLAQHGAVGPARRGRRRRQDHGGRRLGRHEGPIHRRVLRRSVAKVARHGVETADGEEMARRHPHLPQPVPQVRAEENLR